MFLWVKQNKYYLFFKWWMKYSVHFYALELNQMQSLNGMYTSFSENIFDSEDQNTFLWKLPSSI